MADQEDLKRAVGHAAAAEVHDGAVVGLGTGSTARHAIERLGHRVRHEGLSIVGVPTSVASARLAQEVGLPLSTLVEHDVVDITIDGADEVDPALDLIKGGGGALLREKMVAAATRRQVIIVDPSKLVQRLGSRYPLPVEVLDFGVRQVGGAIRALGCEATLRPGRGGAGEAFRTDSGNLIIDCRFAHGIADARWLEAAINTIPGVVDNGLFLGRTHLVLVGEAQGIRRLTPPGP